METIDLLKLVSVPLILGLAIIPGIIPLECRCCRKNERCLSNTHTFAGGVFIAMGMLHIFPETVIEYHEKYPDLQKRFPLPEAMFVLGYCIILLFEKVVCPHSHGDGEDDGHHLHHGMDMGMGMDTVMDMGTTINMAISTLIQTVTNMQTAILIFK